METLIQHWIVNNDVSEERVTKAMRSEIVIGFSIKNNYETIFFANISFQF